MDLQKLGVIDQVTQSEKSGRKIKDILQALGEKPSTYYRWLKQKNIGHKLKTLHLSDRKTSMSLTDEDRSLIIKTKNEYPALRHRQIQGFLQCSGKYYSASSIYWELKNNNLVEKYQRRPTPWDEPFYKMRSRNMMWGADWTKLKIGGERWYLFTMIDFFSRNIISWKILKTVNARNIKDLYNDGLTNLNLTLNWATKPELRVDRGSSNTAHVTKKFFKGIEAELSFARAHRPTDNGRAERFYGTIKQEEIYLVGDYQDEQTANVMISRCINFYDNERPHQSLWNYTSKQINIMNNRTEILKQLKCLKIKCWTERKNYWKTKIQTNPSH